MSHPTQSDSITYYNPFQNPISYHTKPDPSITYHNTFENTIFDNQSNSPPTAMSSQPQHITDNPEIYQHFTATGRPFPSSTSSNTNGFFGGYAAAESFGRAAPNLLPVRFTDASIISVPVLPHAEPSQSKPNAEDSDSDSNTNPVKESKHKSRFSISSFRRKSSSGNAAKKGKQDFVIKEMTRGEYLKHYAKDDNGRFVGSEEPAIDCILNNEEDRVKWRRA